MRLAWFVVLCACSLESSDDFEDGYGGPEEPDPMCARTDTILEPANEAIVSPRMFVVVRWNATKVPFRDMSLTDDLGNIFSPTSHENLTLLSTRYLYELPAARAFTFEMAWSCHTNSGPETIRSRIRFHTQP